MKRRELGESIASPVGVLHPVIEPARQAARALVGTPAYEHSRRARYKIEALFAELKQRMRLSRLRLRRLWNVGEQFLLAATAQNLKRLVRFLAQRPPKLEPQVS
jgi:IS5 family transposase